MPLHLFEAFGVELEYMIVDRRTLAVRPIADAVLKAAASRPGAMVESCTDEHGDSWPDEVSLGSPDLISIGNELTSHLVELKVSEPTPTLAGLSSRFGRCIAEINALLASHNAMLMPTGAHPTMDPFSEMKLWPHGNSEVYTLFNRIFDCRGHGWANLQAAHLNLPFGVDDLEDPDGEFGRLHAAIRFLLPIMPALSASTPILDGQPTGFMDNRLEVYRTNSRKIPAAAGLVIPEQAYTRSGYERMILQPIYDAYAPHDPDGTLRHEWANSRGAIARFMRNAIEIRVLDVQECPSSDAAICAAIVAAVRAIVEGRLGDLREIRDWSVEPLHAMLLDVIRGADHAFVSNEPYLRALGYTRRGACTVGELWGDLIDRVLLGTPGSEEFMPALRRILSRGCLSRRIMSALGGDFRRESIHEVYGRLAACLARNEMFTT